MGKNTSVSLGDYFENFVENKISQGRYNNASEVIRAGLRLLEEEDEAVASLKKAINEGLNSGMAKNFNARKHLKNLKNSKKLNG